MKTKVSTLIILFISIISFTSCDSDVIYEENRSFENNTWSYDDVKEFSFDLDTLTPIKMFLNLRTTVDYEYSNIYMYLHSNYPNGYTDIDTLEFFLAQPDGKWFGETSGTIVENQALITQGYFTDAGTYSFKLEQAMRDNDLTEILDIGLRVEYFTVKEQ
jgi:gliding motility-associated lipoprotein GldH